MKQRDPGASSPRRSTWRRFVASFNRCGPLAAPLFVGVFALCVLTLSRITLTSMYWSRFFDTPEIWKVFPVGLRMDILMISFAIIFPTALLVALPKRIILYLRPFLAFWFTGFIGLVVYMEVATFPFVEEYDVRPDQKFIEYLGHVREVATTLIKVYSVQLALGAIFLFLAVRILWSAASLLLTEYREWKTGVRIVLFPLIVGLLVLGARSSLGHRPANLSTASFSDNHLANEFALNSTYSMTYAAYRMYRHERNPSREYGAMPRDEALARVGRTLQIDPAAFVPESSEIPYLHRQVSPFKRERPLNVVIILEESMGAVDVGCLKGPPITPNLCRLKDEGTWFSRLYATGTRTVRGIEAVVSGFLPTSSVGVLKLPRAKSGFLTAATIFKDKGYLTEFIYGGMSNFDEMRSFFTGNEFDDIYDEPTFKDPVLHGTWGVSDEDLMRRANEIFKGHGDKPFFSLLLTTSNHLPYEFPDGRIELYEQPKQTHLNAIKYADYAIGLFFELAKKEEYYKNTLFLVVADHNSHVRGNEHVPIEKFHIPALLIGPDVPKMDYTKLASQIDLLPTILHFTGLETTHPLVGRNLMTLPESVPGRAFMQYGSNNAYRIEDDVVILRPFLPPEQFTFAESKLEPAPLNQEMALDALAHAHVPWLLYSEERYKLRMETPRK